MEWIILCLVIAAIIVGLFALDTAQRCLGILEMQQRDARRPQPTTNDETRG